MRQAHCHSGECNKPAGARQKDRSCFFALYKACAQLGQCHGGIALLCNQLSCAREWQGSCESTPMTTCSRTCEDCGRLAQMTRICMQQPGCPARMMSIGSLRICTISKDRSLQWHCSDYINRLAVCLLHTCAPEEVNSYSPEGVLLSLGCWIQQEGL